MKNPRFLLCAALALSFLSCAKKNENSAPAPPRTERAAGLEVRDRLGPGMAFPHLPVADHMGNRYDLYHLLSKPRNVVLLIDAFCPACAEEAQKIQKFARAGAGLNVIGISKDSLPAVLAFKKRHNLSFPILFDVEKKLVPDYRRVSFPTLLVVGPDRKILKLYEGAIPRAEAGPFLQMLLE